MTHPIDSLPDIPRWIETRALHRSSHALVLEDTSGCIIRNEHPDGHLVVVVTPPKRALLEEALSDRPDREVLCTPEDEAAVNALLPEWRIQRCCLYQLRDPGQLAQPDVRVRLLTSADRLCHLTNELRTDMEDARVDHEIFAAFSEGKPVSFAYSHWQTEGLFDISIDTVHTHRRQGLAGAAVSQLIRARLETGHAPVWGALESNRASFALATKLGFEKVDEIVLFTQT